MNRAETFAETMRAAWDNGWPDQEQNAVTQAESEGAARIGPHHDQPDVSIYQWPDGSHYGVFDNGDGTIPA